MIGILLSGGSHSANWTPFLLIPIAFVALWYSAERLVRFLKARWTLHHNKHLDSSQ
jgi:hypothetical protein